MDTEMQELDARSEKEKGKGGIAEGLAKLISVMLNPLLMPIWGCLLLLYGPTYLTILPHSLKLYILRIFLLTTLLLPALTVWLLRSLKIIPDYALAARNERKIPLLVGAVGYAACFYLIYSRVNVGLFPQMLIGAFLVVIVCFAINLFWKISLHMAAIGGIMALLLDVTLKGYGEMTACLMISVLLTGILASARLYLGFHTVRQVFAGTVVGIGVMLAALNLF